MNKKYLYLTLGPTVIMIIVGLIIQFPVRRSIGLTERIANAGKSRSIEATGPILYAPIVARDGVLGQAGGQFDPLGCGGLIQEAETATLSGTFETVLDPTTSNGAFIQVPAGLGFRDPQDTGNNYAEFCFTVAETGTYRLGGYIYAPTENNDSFYVSIDGSSIGTFIWDTVRDHGFAKDYASPRNGPTDYTFTLSQGDHTIRLHHREADTRLDALFLELVSSGPAPTATPSPLVPTDETLPTEGSYTLTPGNLNSMWPNLKAGDVVFLDPGQYSGGEITLSVEGTSQNPVHILKTPGKEGKVVINGGSSLNHLFNITGSHIKIGGTQVGPGWEPDFVIQNYGFAAIRMRQTANDIRLHHIHFLDIGSSPGGSNGFAVRGNGQNVIFEFNRIEDPASDVIQVETSGGVNLRNWVVRYNYGSNRLTSSGQQWAWNAASHADFMQIQSGPASDIEIYGNLMIGYTNALILGDSWGTASDVTIRDNLIVYEGNGINSQSKGDVDGTYLIENNHLIMYIVDGVDGGGRSAIYFNDRGGDENVTIRCNIFYGAVDSINVYLDNSIPVTSDHNVETGATSSFDEINSSYVDLGYSMGNARDLSGINKLSAPVAGGDCVQGASFASVNEHYQMIIKQ